MIEAVENHMPEVVIIDEIGTAEETIACRTIAERGVVLIATAHGKVCAGTSIAMRDVGTPSHTVSQRDRLSSKRCSSRWWGRM